MLARDHQQVYADTARNLRLKYSFQPRRHGWRGTCSATAIRSLIKKLVEAEKPSKPISDNTIADILATRAFMSRAGLCEVPGGALTYRLPARESPCLKQCLGEPCKSCQRPANRITDPCATMCPRKWAHPETLRSSDQYNVVLTSKEKNRHSAEATINARRALHADCEGDDMYRDRRAARQTVTASVLRTRKNSAPTAERRGARPEPDARRIVHPKNGV